jgi:uncharacterized protein (DUF3820 family)
MLPSAPFSSLTIMQSTRLSVKTTDGDAAATCPRCGSSEIIFTRYKEGPHWGKIKCLDCGRTAYAKTPWTLARASRFTMPYGKHQGRQLGDLVETEDGLSYVRWLATRDAGNPSIAVIIMLEHVEMKMMST